VRRERRVSRPGGRWRLVLRGPPGVGPVVEGEALVSRQGFSARYDLDRERGVFSRPAHDLCGHSVVGKVLVCTTAKGGIATSWMLLDMVRRGVAPLALLFRTTNPVMVQGAVLAGVALLHRLEPGPQETLRTGDYLRVDPAAGTVEVLAEPPTGEPVPGGPGVASSRSS
jgi:predicted aconitase with swiveling domain